MNTVFLCKLYEIPAGDGAPVLRLQFVGGTDRGETARLAFGAKSAMQEAQPGWELHYEIEEMPYGGGIFEHALCQLARSIAEKAGGAPEPVPAPAPAPAPAPVAPAKRRTAAEVIAFHIGWDFAEMSEYRYQPTRYSAPAIYSCNDSYWSAPANGKMPANYAGLRWQVSGTEYGRTVYEGHQPGE